MTRPERYWAAPVLVCLAALPVAPLVAPSAAAAQACCTATGTGELGVVGRCRQANVALQLGYEHAVGSFDEAGRFRLLDGVQAHDVTLALGAGARLWTGSDLQVHGAMPLRIQHRDLSGVGSGLAVGPGDASLGLRWTALGDTMDGLDFDDADTLVPFLDVYVVGTVPTGRAPEDANDPTSADAMGQGAWGVTGGLKIAKFLTTRSIVTLDGHLTYRFARDVPAASDGAPRRYAPGLEWGARVAFLRIVDIFSSWSLFATLRRTGEGSEDGHALADSESLLLRLGGSVTWSLDYPAWDMTLGLSTPPLWRWGGENIPFAGPSASVTVQRNFY